MTTIFAVAGHRSWDNYFAKFLGFAADLAELQTVFTGAKTQNVLAELTHGKTATLRRVRKKDVRAPDEFVILRYDVPADADQLHVQFIRWKYGGLTMTASHDGAVPWPERIDALNDCVYEAVWTRPPVAEVTNSNPTSPVVTV